MNQDLHLLTSAYTSRSRRGLLVGEASASERFISHQLRNDFYTWQ